MINLMFCGNYKVFDGMLIALLSITKYSKEELNVYILSMDLHEMDEKYVPITAENVKTLEDVVKSANPKSKIIPVDVTKYFKDEMKKCANIKTHYTPYILVRLFSDRCKELPDKILYMDTDIVVYKDIKEIYDVDVEDYDIGATLDAIGKHAINDHYMNSGVLLINLKRVKQDGSFTKAREMCRTKKMMMPDQSALNKTCKILYMPDKYNEQKQRQEDTVIRHFSMTIKWLPFFHLVNIKPWDIERVHKKYKIFDYEDIIEKYREIIGK